MTALLYFLIATFIAFGATRARSRAHIAFLAMAVVVFIVRMFCTVSTTWTRNHVDTVNMFLPFRHSPSPLRALMPHADPMSLYRSKMALTAVALLPTAFGVTSVGTGPNRHFLPLVAAGLYAMCAMAYAIYKLWQVQESVALRVEKVRLKYLIGVISTSSIFAFAETLGRVLIPPNPSDTLSISARAFELQGPMPPMSVLAAGSAVLCLYHIWVNYRLLDLYDMFSRLATLVLSALALALVDGVTVTWVDTFLTIPSSTFQVFLSHFVSGGL